MAKGTVSELEKGFSPDPKSDVIFDFLASESAHTYKRISVVCKPSIQLVVFLL